MLEEEEDGTIVEAKVVVVIPINHERRVVVVLIDSSSFVCSSLDSANNDVDVVFVLVRHEGTTVLLVVLEFLQFDGGDEKADAA